MKLSFLLLVLLMGTPLAARSQQQSFTVAGIKPFDKAVPGQVMDVLIEGLNSDAAPMPLPATAFKVEVSQDGVTQLAKVRIVKFTMVPVTNTDTVNRNTIDFAGMKMRAYQSVSFVVPKGLHSGPAEVIASYKGQRGNAVAMEIIEKPLRPLVATTAVLAAGGLPPDRTPGKLAGNDMGWRLERGATARISVHPLVDPDDPEAAFLIRFKQDGNDYDAVTRIASSPSRVEERGRGVGFFVAREEVEVDVPPALVLGKAEMEIRLKANGQVSDPVNITAAITDMTRAAEVPNATTPRVLLIAPNRIGAGQSVQISVDHRRTLEQGDEKFTLSPNDFSLYSNDALIVRLPEDLTAGNVKFTIENFDGERYSTPVTKSFVLTPRQ